MTVVIMSAMSFLTDTVLARVGAAGWRRRSNGWPLGHRRWPAPLVLAIATTLVAVTGTGAAADPRSRPAPATSSTHAFVHTVALFDESAGQSPEGITRGLHGRLYVSWKPLQQIVRIEVDGSATVVATLPGAATGIGGLVGLTTAPDGSILGALANNDPRYNGVWRFTPGRGASRLAALPTTAFPNDLTLTPDGSAVLVTDSTGGRVFRIDLATGSSEVWLDDTRLAPTDPSLPVGANGITVWRGDRVVVASSNQDLLLSVPLRAGGKAGAPSVIGHVNAPDGVRALGNRLVVAQPEDNTIVTWSAGCSTVLADTADGLDLPVSLLVERSGFGARILSTQASLTDADSRPGVVAVELR